MCIHVYDFKNIYFLQLLPPLLRIYVTHHRAEPTLCVTQEFACVPQDISVTHTYNVA